MTKSHTLVLGQTIERLNEQAETVTVMLGEYIDGQPLWADDEPPGDDVPTINDVATSAVVLLHEAFTLVAELREAGADIAEAPVEPEALVTVIANGQMIHKDMEATVAHMESVLKRVKA